jgi:arylformamidase
MDIPRSGGSRGIEMEIYDISQTLWDGMAVWPGDPEFLKRWVLRMREGGSSNVSAVDMGAHTGTHIDAPLHLDDSGSDVASMPLRHFMGPARIFSISSKACIRAADLSMLDWRGVERVLFKTGARGLPEYSFDRDFVYLEEGAAEFLVRQGILLVGTDAPSIDAFESSDLPSHRALLHHGIVILEGARLDGVPPGDYELICLPLKLAGSDGSPVRAILREKQADFRNPGGL